MLKKTAGRDTSNTIKQSRALKELKDLTAQKFPRCHENFDNVFTGQVIA